MNVTNYPAYWQGIKDYRAGVWVERRDPTEQVIYEVGRLTAASSEGRAMSADLLNAVKDNAFPLGTFARRSI